jgi:hypothetical protein
MSEQTVQGSESTSEQKIEDLLARIRSVDEWFRHAENIGQQRLYNFFMAGAVILVACAALLQLKPVGCWLSAFLAGGGCTLSIAWFFLGTRQIKFHGHLQHVVDEALEQLRAAGRDPQMFGYYWIRYLQKNQVDKTSSFHLNRAEEWLSSRYFLKAVPALFILLYIALILGAFVQIAYSA